MRTLSFFIFIWLVFSYKMYSQCSVTPWMTAGAISSDASFGTYGFNNLTNAGSSDNQYAEAASTVSLFSGNTEYLMATAFGFAIPLSATICGLEVEVERSADNIGLFTSVDDASVRIVKNGSVTGSNHASGTNWTSTDAVATYGSASDGWSALLTTANINAGDFGVAISARINGLVSLLPVARIDQVRMRVHYMVMLALNENEFTVKEDDGSVFIQSIFKQAALTVLERSKDQVKWQPVHEFQPSEKISWRDNNLTDGDYYYRLKTVNGDGSILYSNVKHVYLKSVAGFIVESGYSGDLFIHSGKRFSSIELFAMSGQQLYSRRLGTPVNSFTVPVDGFGHGVYILKVDGKVQKIRR